MDKIFIDTAPFIYLCEASDGKEIVVKDRLSEWLDDGAELLSSVLTLTELLVHPKRNKDFLLAARYKNMLRKLLGEPLNVIDQDTAELAADLRGKYTLKTPDSLQVSSAIINGCSHFYTNDKRLLKISEIEVVVAL